MNLTGLVHVPGSVPRSALGEKDRLSSVADLIVKKDDYDKFKFEKEKRKSQFGLKFAKSSLKSCQKVAAGAFFASCGGK